MGDPTGTVDVGPVVSLTQFNKIQALIASGIAEGATLVAGGLGRAAGISTGYFVQPTVFADVTSDMTIARDEVFGPVLAIVGYDDIEDAITIANDTPYGLSGYIQGSDPDRIAAVAARRGFASDKSSLIRRYPIPMHRLAVTSSQATDASGASMRSRRFWRPKRCLACRCGSLKKGVLQHDDIPKSGPACLCLARLPNLTNFFVRYACRFMTS